MLLSAVVKLIFFSFQKIFQYLVHTPFFQNLKQKIPTFCNPTRNSCNISSVFTIKKCVQKWPIQIDKVHISKIKLISTCLVSPMLLNVYLNKSKTKRKAMKEVIEKQEKQRKAVHRLIISSSELRERERILQLNLIVKKTNIL